MKQHLTLVLALACAMALGGTALAGDAFTVTSPDVKDGGTLGLDQVLNMMGCEGKNLSPALNWSNAPEGTRSFAVTAYDPDVRK